MLLLQKKDLYNDKWLLRPCSFISITFVHSNIFSDINNNNRMSLMGFSLVRQCDENGNVVG